MYRLYWHPSASSYAPMAVLEELGVEFDLHEVDYDGGETRSPEYRRLQPLGLIPALELDDGSSMFESAAIILYLCDRHESKELAPLIGEVERPRYLQWLCFLTDTLYPSYNRYYHPERYTSTANDIEGVKEQARHSMLMQWRIIEDTLQQSGPWLLGSRFSSCDIYLQMISTWHEKPSELLAEFPCVRDVVRGVIARKACRRAFDRHNYETGLE